MANVSGTLNLGANFSQQISSGVIADYSIPANLALNLTLGNGTSAGKVDLCYAKKLNLAGSATTLDLSSIADVSGATVNFARVRLLIVQNLATTAGYTVTLGSAASNQWTGFLGTSTSTVIVPPNVGATANQSLFLFTDLYSVGASTGAYVDGTHKSFKIDPGANTLDINLLILGCSAAS